MCYEQLDREVRGCYKCNYTVSRLKAHKLVYQFKGNYIQKLSLYHVLGNDVCVYIIFCYRHAQKYNIFTYKTNIFVAYTTGWKEHWKSTSEVISITIIDIAI